MKNENFFAIFVLIFLTFIWGSSFILIKFGLEVYSATEVASMRIFFSFLCLFPLMVMQWKKVPKKAWGPIMIVGFIGSCIPAFMFAFGQTKLSSSTTGVLNSLVPIFTFIFGVLFFKNQFNGRKLAGVLIGLLGAVLLIILRTDGSFDPNYAYGFFIVLATICYGTSVNVVKNYLQDVPALTISSMSFSVIGILCGIYLLGFTDFTSKIVSGPTELKAAGYIFLLAAFGTALALIMFNKLVQLKSALFATTTTYLIPIVALGWGILDGEDVGLLHLVGMGTILIGVYLANVKRKVRTTA
ncbi:MAG: drug/metabolite transporter (DMT)-like permease [Sphingobacteriales bacterium]|jgi:drug/metabolite transporter (DMT)-like permease